MDPLDPRSVISIVSMQDQGGTNRLATFQNSSTFLKLTTWANSPLTPSPVATATTPGVSATSPADFDAVVEAQHWTAAHGMVANNTQLPMTVQRIFFAKARPNFLNNFYFDMPGGVTSTDIQLSFRDNSGVGGNFIDSALGTIPAFCWSGATFGGTGRLFQISFNRPGRFYLVLRVIDNTGNYSMFELDFNVVD